MCSRRILTQALATGARTRGAQIHRNTTVTGISRTASGEWCVQTDKGEIVCEHVVSATGNFARRTGAMVGLDVPVIPVQHQYIVTEPHPEIQARHAAGVARDGGTARIGRLMVPARGAGRAHSRPVRDRRSGVLRGRPRRGLRVRAVPGGSGAPGAAHRGRHQPGAGVRRGGGEADVQRCHLLHPGRQPDHRTRRGASTTSGSTKATASGSPRPAAPASSSRSGSWRASRPST